MNTRQPLSAPRAHKRRPNCAKFAKTKRSIPEQRNEAVYAVLAARLGQLRERQATARTPARPSTAAAPPNTD